MGQRKKTLLCFQKKSNQAIFFLFCFFQKCLIFKSSSFSKNVIIPRNLLSECFPRSILPLTFPNSPSNYLLLTSVTFFYVIMRTFQIYIFFLTLHAFQTIVEPFLTMTKFKQTLKFSPSANDCFICLLGQHFEELSLLSCIIENTCRTPEQTSFYLCAIPKESELCIYTTFSVIYYLM